MLPDLFGIPAEGLQGGTKPLANDPVGAGEMTFPTLSRGLAIDRDVEAEDQPSSFSPVDAGRVGVEQLGVNWKVLPIIVRCLTAWRYISQHKKLQM